jgi:hypothetical protein
MALCYNLLLDQKRKAEQFKCNGVCSSSDRWTGSDRSRCFLFAADEITPEMMATLRAVSAENKGDTKMQLEPAARPELSWAQFAAARAVSSAYQARSALAWMCRAATTGAGRWVLGESSLPRRPVPQRLNGCFVLASQASQRATSRKKSWQSSSALWRSSILYEQSRKLAALPLLNSALLLLLLSGVEAAFFVQAEDKASGRSQGQGWEASRS